MNISASSPTLFTASTTVSAGVAAAAPAAPIQDTAAPSNEGSGRAHGHRGHGNHGHLRQALNEALQGLGLSGAKGPGDHGGDRDAGNGKHDIAQFMHALFQAVKGETAAAPAATGAPSGGAKGNFAAGLSALIIEAGSGTVPQALQDAFNQLPADFHLAPTPATAAPAPATLPVTLPATTTPAAPADPVPATGILALPGASPAPISLAPAAGDSSSVVAAGNAAETVPVSATSIDPPATPAAATTTSTGTSASTPTALTLQALLSRLQQALGYGSRSGWSTPPTGNTVNLTA